jgi:predicted O-linked N-acetylglucosamine transferase (SPINDLY family)
VDLSLHAIDNRMLTFARKPAPVQMTYLAYCAGSGLETMDYRLTDRWIDPAGGAADGRTFERPLRLETYWCYGRHPQTGEVAAAPVEKNGYVTFGSFNYFSKVNREVLALWTELLRRMPEAKLVLHVPMGSRQEYVRGVLMEERIDLARVTLLPRTNEKAYFEQYGMIDVALDPFPFAGGTTTCDALYMGVPVVTLVGDRTTTRGGMSILSTLGLGELVAHTRAEYLAIAEGLGRDAERLVTLRRELRGRMEGSMLMDAGRFAQNIESLYRQAWRKWCENINE